jgi:hypothetical protein
MSVSIQRTVKTQFNDNSFSRSFHRLSSCEYLLQESNKTAWNLFRKGVPVHCGFSALNLPSMSSSSAAASVGGSASASNRESTAAVLNSREIIFDSVGTGDLRKMPPPRQDFGEVWASFILAAQDLTGLTSADHQDATTALASFLQVMKRVHENEREFKILLFWALRNALGDLCEPPKSSKPPAKKPKAPDGKPAKRKTGEVPTTDGGPIRLRGKGVGVGFVTEVLREETLKFSEDYGMAKGSKPDIACIVFAEDESQAADVTVSVELKTSSTTCKYYDFLHAPALTDEHAPLGQTLSYGTDVHQCLTRRAVSVETIPAIVLASKVKTEDSEGFLCCIEASLHIPPHLGGTFNYRVEQSVPFPKLNTDATADALYEQAITILIKTLLFGLTKAAIVKENKKQNKAATSLCCSSPRSDLLLVASPIPHAQPSFRGLKISQGELYEFHEVNTTVKDWIEKIDEEEESEPGEQGTLEEELEEDEGGKMVEEKSVLVFNGSPSTDKNCIIKVSCSTVHKYLVSAEHCWAALKRIESKESAKAAIAPVMLACAYVSQRCLVVVMKNLGSSNKLLDWAGFSQLVKTALLPLAQFGVVHTDIRFDPEKRRFANIVADSQTGEWRMIDFESLIIFRGASGSQAEQDYAVGSTSFPDSASAYTFLHWQVLWVAYVLWACVANQSVVSATLFLQQYNPSEQSVFSEFNRWMGPADIPAIPPLRDYVRYDRSIRNTLEFFNTAFSSHMPTNQA